jgi:hypothetical protein
VSDDYLWDRTGADDEVQRLERALRPVGHDPAAEPPALPRRRRRLLLAIPLVAAAAAGALFVLRPQVTASTGVLVEAGGRSGVVFEGAWVEEGNLKRVIRLGAAGEVQVDAGARVQVVRIREDENRLRLEEGTVHARISASTRPRFFQIETPATNCVDLGCAYTLTVDAAGNAVVRVDYGRVSFEDGAREVYVPAGAVCAAEKGRGAGTPHFLGSGNQEAVRKFDAARGEDRRSVATIVAAQSGNPRDSLTLWHLLQDPDEVVRAVALQALERPGCTRASVPKEATLAREKGALEAWREVLEPDWR